MNFINNDLVTKVMIGLEICTNDNLRCSTCPYFGKSDCSRMLKTDSLTLFMAYRKQLNNVVEVNEKNVDKLIAAEMEIEHHMGRADALEQENGELKKNNAILTEQNKKLLETVVENTRLRNENQSLRDELDSDKKLMEDHRGLCTHLRDQLDTEKLRNRMLMNECDRQKEELARYKEQEQTLAKQPMVLHTEPVKIESINYAKMAKAADKATKACNDLTKALEELDRLYNKHGVIKMNDIRAQFGLPPYNPKPREIAKEGDVLCMDRDSGGMYYREVQYVDANGIHDRIGCVKPYAIHSIYRKDENGNLKLIWKRK